MPEQSLVPGGIAIIKFDRNDKRPHFNFRGKPILVHKHNNEYIALVGLPLNLKPGEYFIEGKWGNESGLNKKFFKVRSKQYTTQHITIKDKRKVNPYTKDIDRILKEKNENRKHDWRTMKRRPIWISNYPRPEF